ncbi:bifunctional 3-deoxy-7-phosphoheptulonate synthase/chorismate mutase [Paenibacillus sp. GYB003]|uniref:bifunctional 3-deoxy-7-phosphoheptulonate synthase/chorismate mutase n=1 Tax=Paenibacillus sp. GYB003 TaxID=2994392 RepID=UPI002F9668A7
MRVDEHLEKLGNQLDGIDQQLLVLLNERARIAAAIGQRRESLGLPTYDPAREKRKLAELTKQNPGPVDNARLERLFEEIAEVPHEKQRTEGKRQLLVSRKTKSEDTVVRVKDAVIGGSAHVLVAGPCSVESREQMRAVAAAMKSVGLNVLRGGAFKPRTSPYDFQGLGREGLKLLKEVADEFEMVTISEIMSPSQLEYAAEYIDVIQIGARNMQNFDLLKAAGQMNMPVLLKRGIAATLDEFVYAAEYVMAGGNERVMLIERGIRTYEKWTRNTLDISAVPLLKQETHLPVLVDVSHSTGRKDILLPCAKAALAAGADGIMVEVHPEPQAALSDSGQQIDIGQFRAFWSGLSGSGLFKRCT